MVWKDNDPFSQTVVFEAQWTDTPEPVYNEVRDLWQAYELGNDWFYFTWDSTEHGEDYPMIDAFLKDRGITKCLIHWWW